MAVFTQEQKNAVLKVREFFEGYLDWAVAAGCAAIEYGYPKTANDIDIIVRRQDLTRANRLLEMLTPTEVIQHGKPAEYIGFKIALYNADIEFFADPVFHTDQGIFKYSADDEMFRHTRKIMLKERDFVPVISPEDTLAFYALRQNREKYDEIRIKHILAKQHIDKELLLRRIQKIGEEKAYERASKVLPI